MADQSSSLGISTILGCLMAGEPKMVGALSNAWHAPLSGGNPDMDYFLQHQFAWREGMQHIRDGFQSFATLSQPEVVAKMAEWKMRLPPPPVFAGRAVYMISQLKELLSWMEKGTRHDHRVAWPEFRLNKGVSFMTNGVTSEPLVLIRTKNGDLVSVMRYEPALSGFELLKFIEQAEENVKFYPGEFDSVQIPCVLADMKPSLNWILRMENLNDYIAFALQAILFGMNEEGFAQREETLMASRSFSVMAGGDNYLLSPEGQSFMFWRRRRGVEFPLSMYQFARPDFKDPGDLKKIVE